MIELAYIMFIPIAHGSEAATDYSRKCAAVCKMVVFCSSQTDYTIKKFRRYPVKKVNVKSIILVLVLLIIVIIPGKQASAT